MREPARLQAAIEILDAVITSARDNGAAADTIVARWFQTRRFAGSKDRAAIRDLVWGAIRHSGERPADGRSALIGYLRAQEPERLQLFDGSPHAPAPLTAHEPATPAALAPAWMLPRLRTSLGADWRAELEALAGRAPLDLRVNRLKATSARDVAATLPFPSTPVELPGTALPLALRAAAGSPVETTEAFQQGLVELQDAGSQAAVALAGAAPGQTVVDLCAGAGGKTLALGADMAGEGRIIASDTDRGRLSALVPRARRAGVAATIETRLLNPGREAEGLRDLVAAADVVLVDAPCSGTGTWRRNPELRWRLTEARLAARVALQGRLLELGAALVKPGGRLVYAVCSVLREEGADLAAHVRPWGLPVLGSLRLTPLVHACDGFFIACWQRPC